MELYISNEQYSLLLRSFIELAYVPEDKVLEVFKHLSDSVPQDVPMQGKKYIKELKIKEKA